MKKIQIVVLTFITFTVSAILLMPFPGYDWLEEHSPNIFIASCSSNPPTFIHSGVDDVNAFSIKIVASIKGTNYTTVAILNSLHWLNMGDSYLVFGDFRKGAYQAIEDFRVIPLGRELMAGMTTNAIAGKSQDEQIQILLKHSLDNLNRQMKAEHEEKQRLEEGVRK